MIHIRKCLFHIVLIVVGIGLSRWNTWPGRLLVVLYLFLFLFLSPVTKGRENLWMFFMVTCVFIPLNRPIISGIFEAMYNLTAFGYFLAAGLWAAEQIVLGIITRMIWPKQKIIHVKI